MIEPEVESEPLRLVPAARASELSTAGIVHVESVDDLAFLAGIPKMRVAWVETSLELATDDRLLDVALDVVLREPKRESAALYALARVRAESPPRLTIPAVPGVEQAGAIALALHLPVRLALGQPSPDVVRELESLLERYLHDPHASEPIEPFHSALATLIHGDPATLWEVLEAEPDIFPRGDNQEPEFVARHVAALEKSGAECVICPLLKWCRGYFKHPDPSYSCVDVRRLFGKLEEAAMRLRQDLSEAETLLA